MGTVHHLRRPRPLSTDDLLHYMATMIHKAEREPETAKKSLTHAARAFERIVERIS